MDVSNTLCGIFDSVIQGHENEIFKKMVNKYSIFIICKICHDINYKHKEQILNIAMKIYYESSHPLSEFHNNIYAL
jgi:hypothetical protein